MSTPWALAAHPHSSALSSSACDSRCAVNVAELAAVVGSEPEHLVGLQEDIDLGTGQVVDLGFGDVAAHTDGVHTYSWTPRRSNTSARVGPAERAPDWSCSASWCMRCQSAGSAAARVAMRNQPERNSSSAARSTTGAWVIPSSSVSNAATLAAGKAPRTAVKVRSMCGWGRSCRWTVMTTPNLLPAAACHPSYRAGRKE